MSRASSVRKHEREAGRREQILGRSRLVKIRLRASWARGGQYFGIGEKVDVDTVTADRLVSHGLAEKVE
jgi:hypothetical protein